MTTKKWLLILTIAAAVLRIAYVSIHDPIPLPYQVNLDEIDFNYLGKSIADGRGFTDKYGEATTTRFPLYPCFLAVIYYVFGHHIYIVFLFQAVIGAAMAILAYLITREFFERNIALIAAGITAFYPYFIDYSGRLMSENLFIPEMSLIILFAVKFHKSPGVKYAFWLGLTMGISFLTRGVIMPLMAVSPVLVLFIAKGKFLHRIKIAAVLTTAIAIALSPWALRNYSKYHKLFVSSSEGWPVMWMSYFPIPTGEFFKLDRAYAYVDSVGRENASYEEFNRILVDDNFFGITGIHWYFQNLYPGQEIPKDEMQFGLKVKELFIAKIKENPGVLVFKHVKEALRFWHFVDDRGDFVLGYGFIIPFFMVSLWMLRKRLLKELWIPLLFFLYIWIMETFFQAAARYRLPFEIVLIVIGSYSFYMMFVKLKPVFIPLALTSILVGMNIYFSVHDYALRGFIRFLAAKAGLAVIQESDSYKPELNSAAPVDTLDNNPVVGD